MKNYIKQMLTVKGEGGIEVEELLVFPGLEELFSLFKILEYEVIRKDDYLALRILLPFASKGEMDLRQNGNEIILSIKNETKRFIVSGEFENAQIEKAQFEEGNLVIVFQENKQNKR